MRLFLFSTSKSIWSRLLQPQFQIVKSPDYVGLVPNFRNLDMVQPRIRRRLANRSWFRFAGANRCALFYSGPPIATCRRSVLHPGFWKLNRVTHHITSLPLFVLASAKRKSLYLEESRAQCSEKQPNAHPFRKPACNTRARDCRLYIRPFSFHLRLSLHTHTGSGAGALVSAW